jgi:hypothetical protein
MDQLDSLAPIVLVCLHLERGLAIGEEFKAKGAHVHLGYAEFLSATMYNMKLTKI